MHETRKSALRRYADPVFRDHYFVGHGIDIGAGDDPLSNYTYLFPGMRNVVSWDLEQGDALAMDGLEDRAFDFVHSSHCLEHLANPFEALGRWLDLVKPGGYVVVTVPDEDLYEKGVWPSRFNADHKFSFTIQKPRKALAQSVNVSDLVRAFSNVAACERIVLIRHDYDERSHHIDQTASGNAECAIEFVLRKRDVRSVQAMMTSADRQPDADSVVAAYRQTLEHYPYHFSVYHQFFLILLDLGRVAETETLWNYAVQRLPNRHSAWLYQALNKMGMGEIEWGFRLREALIRKWRWERRTEVQPPVYPAWSGESLEGRSIVIWSEFGLGDEMFFLRFAAMLKDQMGASRVSVVCQDPLYELFQTASRVDAVYSVSQAQAGEVAHHDYWVYPYDIPAYLPLDIEHLPATVPYCHARRTELLPVRPGRESALKVGIVFKGAPTHENDHWRSLSSLSVLDQLFERDDVTFYSLQKGEGAVEAATYAARLPNFIDLGPTLQTFSDTAACVATMDLIISVDTSVANLAGAMGKPLCVLLPPYGDWRWHYVRDDSPWYPSATLFRRRLHESWEGVVSRVKAYLDTFASNDAPCPAEKAAGAVKDLEVVNG